LIATMPDTPGRTEALQALLDRFEAVEEDVRSETFVVIAAAMLTVMGKAAPPVIRQLIQKTAGLPSEAQAEVNDLLKAYAAEPEAFSLPPEDKVPSVYDICCTDRIDRLASEEEEEGEHVHGPGCNHDHGPSDGMTSNMPGRNDPCWCGSGKKYKKCHLEEDEAQRRA
jgi:hypothetical protein